MSFQEELTLLLEDLLKDRLSSVLTGCVASVESHDTVRMTADIKPLIFFTDEKGERQEYAVIPDVPVLFLHAGGYILRPKYKRGDLVWVTFATHDIASPLAGRNADSSRPAFSRENAAVVCGIAGGDFSAPEGMDRDGVLIASKGGGMRLLLAEDSISAKCSSFSIEGNLSVSGKAEVGEDVIWNSKALATKASSHIHNTGVGPSAPPTGGS